MRALQFQYTSCRRGITGYAGFQTRAESPGLRHDERRELESKALYQPPRDLPSEPDASAIAGLFPKAFRIVNLASGRMALIRSCYSGQDYSGRWGNYFAHGLVLDDLPDGRWLIEVYSWPGWVDGLGEGEDDQEPVPLPEVPLSDLAGGADFDFNELRTFLGEREAREHMLAQMISAVFRRTSELRDLVIREELELDAVYWIACILKAFPAGCQRELTCSTYQFDPRSTLAINATNGETDFLFDVGERKQFYLFDFVTGQHSEIPVDHPEYANLVAAWMASDPGQLENFQSFAALFDVYNVGPDLLHLLRLYQLQNGEQLSLTTSEISAVLQFIVACAKPGAFARVLGAMGDVTRSLCDTATSEDWALVIRFLAEGAATTGEAEHLRGACQAWVDAFDHFVIEQRREDDSVLAIRAEVESRFTDGASAMALVFLAKEHLDWMWVHVSQLSGSSLNVVMTELERSCRQLGREPTCQAQEIYSLIEAVLSLHPGHPPDLQWAFTPYKTDVEGISSIVTRTVSILEVQTHDSDVADETWSPALGSVGRSLAHVLGAAGDDFRFRVLNKLKENDRFAGVLIGEWEAFIDRAANKIEAHDFYERNVLSDDSEVTQKLRDELATALLKVLPQEHQRRQARDWVESGRCRRLSNEVAGIVLALAIQDVTLATEDQASEHLAGLIVPELVERKLRLDLNRLEMRSAARRVLSEERDTNGIRRLVQKSDQATYREFLEIVLPRLLSTALTKAAIRKVLASLAVDPHMTIFAEAYAAYLTQRPKDSFDTVDVAAIVFWLKLDASDATWSTLGQLKQPAIDALAKRLSLMSGKNRSKIGEELEAHSGMRDPGFSEVLKNFLALANDLQPSWFGRLLHRSRK